MPVRPAVAPARAGGWIGVLALCATAWAVWVDVAAPGVLAGLDEPLLRAARERREPWLDAVARGVTELGGGWGRCALAAVVAAPVAVRLRRWWPVVAAAAVLVLAPLLAEALKAATAVPRPPAADALVVASSASFPSGHALGAAAIAVVLAAGVLRARGTPAARTSAAAVRRRVVVVALAACWALAVGVSRVHLGVHWPTDVLAGWALGAALGWAVLLVVRPPPGGSGDGVQGDGGSRAGGGGRGWAGDTTMSW